MFATMNRISLPVMKVKAETLSNTEYARGATEMTHQIKCQIADLRSLNESILDWSKHYLSHIERRMTECSGKILIMKNL